MSVCPCDGNKHHGHVTLHKDCSRAEEASIADHRWVFPASLGLVTRSYGLTQRVWLQEQLGRWGILEDEEAPAAQARLLTSSKQGLRRWAKSRCQTAGPATHTSPKVDAKPLVFRHRVSAPCLQADHPRKKKKQKHGCQMYNTPASPSATRPRKVRRPSPIG